MNIVMDSNVLFSALLKDSMTRKLIINHDGFFLFPSFVFHEMDKHKDFLVDRSGMDLKDFESLMQMILRHVVIVPMEVMMPFREIAVEIVRDIDKDDAVFVACVLAYPEAVLWSDDKKLKKIKEIDVLSTEEIMKLI